MTTKVKLDKNVEDTEKLVPAGGTTEQILSKIDNTDFNTHWVDKPTGSGGGDSTYARFWHWESTATSGTAISFASSPVPFGGYGVQNPAANGNAFTAFPFTLAAGTYSFLVWGFTDSNRGKLDWYLDDVLIVSGQNWQGGSVPSVLKTTTGIVVPSGGAHTLRGVVNGTTNTTYYICISYYYFIKTG